MKMDKVKQRIDNEKRLFKKASHELAMTDLPWNVSDDIEALYSEPILIAVRKVADFLGVQIATGVNSSFENMENEEAVFTAANSFGMRARRISLNDNWYRSDSGPFVGFTKKGEAVALLPYSPSGYVIKYQDGRSVKINAKSDNTILKTAYMLIKPFDAGKNSFISLLMHSFSAIWKRDMFKLIISILAMGLMGIAIPVATGIIFTMVIPMNQNWLLVQVGIFLAAATLSSIFFHMARSVLIIRLYWKMDPTVEFGIWDKLLDMDISFFKKNTPGDLFEATKGVSRLMSMFSSASVSITIALVYSISNIAVMMYYNTGMAFTVLGGAVIILITTAFTAGFKYKYEKELLRRNSEMTSFLSTLFSGLEALKSVNSFSHMFFIWAKGEAGRKKAFSKSESFNIGFSSFAAAFPVIASAGIFLLYVKGYSSSLSTGKFIAFNSAFLAFFTAIFTLCTGVFDMITTRLYYKQIFPILDSQKQVQDINANRIKIDGKVELNNLSLEYEESNKNVFNGISVQFQKGEMVAICGLPGSGKTSLLKIIAGLEKPTSGKVYIDGHEVLGTDGWSPLGNVGIVLQDGEFCVGDIYSNIGFNKTDISEDDVWKAAEMVQIDKFIKGLPDKMATIVGDGGMQLSSWEKTAILTARAIVKRPGLLLLDDCFACFDNECRESLFTIVKNMDTTAIIVSSDPNVLKKCDRVLFIHENQLHDSGSYEELNSANERFKERYAL